MNNKTAVIIAGGLNTRINMIKPLINLGGKQLLIRIHDVLKEIFSEIILVIRQNQDGEIPDLGLALKMYVICLLYTSPSPRDRQKSRMPSSA